MRSETKASLNRYQGLSFAFFEVKNFPEMTPFQLRHQLSLVTYKQIRQEAKSIYDQLNLLLDREILLRRRVDQIVDAGPSYFMERDL